MRTTVLLGVVIACSFSSRQACRAQPHALDALTELHKSTDCRPGKAQISGSDRSCQAGYGIACDTGLTLVMLITLHAPSTGRPRRRISHRDRWPTAECPVR